MIIDEKKRFFIALLIVIITPIGMVYDSPGSRR